MGVQAKHASTWKDAEPWVKQGGVWVKPDTVWAKASGVWEQVWAGTTVFEFVQEVTVNKSYFSTVPVGWTSTEIPAWLTYNRTMPVGNELRMFWEDNSSVNTLRRLRWSEYTVSNGVIATTDVKNNLTFTDPNTTIEVFNDATGLLMESWTPADNLGGTPADGAGTENQTFGLYPQNNGGNPASAWDNPAPLAGEAVRIRITAQV